MITAENTRVKLRLLKEDNRPLEECVKSWVKGNCSADEILLMTLAKVGVEFIAEDILDSLDDSVFTYNCVEVIYTELEEKYKNRGNIDIESAMYILNIGNFYYENNTVDDPFMIDYADSENMVEDTLYHSNPDKVAQKLKKLKVITKVNKKMVEYCGGSFEIKEYTLDHDRIIELYHQIKGE